MTTYTKTLLTLVTILGLSACGGESNSSNSESTSSSSSSSSSSNSESSSASSSSSEGTYSSIADLEYKTLNLRFKGKDLEEVYAFKKDYKSIKGEPKRLVDYRKNTTGVCMEIEKSDKFTYMCLIDLKDSGTKVYALKIESDGTINGNYKKFQSTDTTALTEVEYNADASVTGKVTITDGE